MEGSSIPGLDFEGDVLEHPDYLNETYTTGKELVEAVKNMNRL